MTNAPLNLSFGSTATTTTAAASPFSLGNTLSAKTVAPSSSTQLTLGTTTNVTTSAAPGKLSLLHFPTKFIYFKNHSTVYF